MWSSLFLFYLVVIMQSIILKGELMLPADYIEEIENIRVKRIMDSPKDENATPAPPTSEEIREKLSGTESPHIDDYNEQVYKMKEVREGEWSSNPIPKTKTQNVTKVSSDEPKKAKASEVSEAKSPQSNPLMTLFSPFFGGA